MDRIINALSADGMVRLVAADTRETVAQAQAFHKTTPTTTALLGRVLTAAAIMGSDLKDENFSVTLRIDGDGPAGYVLAVSDGTGFSRGYVLHPEIDLPLNEKGKLDVGGAIGKGSLTVIKDLRMKEPYIGKIPLVSGEIAEDVTAYLYQSEQTPGVCALGVLVGRNLDVAAAGGFILSLMPGADEAVISRVEADIKGLRPMTEMLSQGMALEDIAGTVLKTGGFNITRSIDIGYRCRCSEDRVEQMLLSLGRAELEALAKESSSVEVTCQFCDRRYKIPVEELLKKAK
jgi:molecular chaperone Hsp33